MRRLSDVPLRRQWVFHLRLVWDVQETHWWDVTSSWDVVMMMMMMNCFCGMVDRRKAFSLISSRDHCQRSSPSRISDTSRAGFEPAQNLSPGIDEWSCAVVITTTPCSNKMSWGLPLTRLGDVPPRCCSVFHLRHTCDVAWTYRETLWRRRYNILLPRG